MARLSSFSYAGKVEFTIEYYILFFLGSPREPWTTSHIVICFWLNTEGIGVRFVLQAYTVLFMQ